jgi:hypothetical protein
MKNLTKLLNINQTRILKIYKTQSKGILIYGDRQANLRALESHIPISDKTYYTIMKDFLNEGEGVPFGSVKYKAMRIKYYQKIYEAYHKEVLEQNFIQTAGNQ